DVAETTQASTGFLADHRNGVIPQRMFAIPREIEEIETLWSQGIGEGWGSFAVANDRAITLEQRDDLECVTCYQLSYGRMLWMESHPARHEATFGGIGPRSTPTIDGNRVYAQGATGKVWCLDLESGNVIWTVDLLKTAGWTQQESEELVTWGRAGSPLIVDPGGDGQRRLCVLPYGGPAANAQTGRSLIALDAEDGSVVWTAGEDQISFASPAQMTLAGVAQIVSVNERTVTGHRLDDGKVLWSFDWPGNSNGDANCAMPIPAGKDRFLVGKGYGGGSALVEVKAKADGLVADAVWTSTRVLKTKFTHACVDGEIAYAISNGSLEAVRVTDAQRLWQQPRRSRYQQGQILLVDDVIVVQAETGQVALVEADENQFNQWLQIPALESKTWNVPTVAGRHLIVRNDRQAICFLLPARQ
ncbi:MAG: PQQ-binding-like beta-propeller repeat protein, partial [Pirellulales bacterium]|nr:PQQ-binding-like beta-propeller repeat protein [Pirellulales bacterium]